MKGVWTGTYKHESKYLSEEIRNRLTEFTIEILDFDGINFSGTVEDNGETGGTRGVGRIEGKIKNDKIWFVKSMPVRTILMNNELVEEDKPHRKIYYSGIYNTDGSVQGTWRFRPGFGIINRKIVFFPSTKGIWKMVKKEIP